MFIHLQRQNYRLCSGLPTSVGTEAAGNLSQILLALLLPHPYANTNRCPGLHAYRPRCYKRRPDWKTRAWCASYKGVKALLGSGPALAAKIRSSPQDLQRAPRSSWSFRWRVVAFANVVRGRGPKRSRGLRVKLRDAAARRGIGAMPNTRDHEITNLTIDR